MGDEIEEEGGGEEDSRRDEADEKPEGARTKLARMSSVVMAAKGLGLFATKSAQTCCY